MIVSTVFSDGLDFILSFFASFFTWLDSSFLIGTTSYLAVFVVSTIIFVLIDNFIAKG